VINKVATIEKKKCIRCYCCHEMCQYNAIELHKSLLYKLLNHG
jgi:MinD superfamily P-loop ATPase